MPLTFSQRLIVEEKLNESRILLENICRGLTEEQNKIIRGIHREFLPLIEATLTTDQISQLFKNVEQSATASGSNRTGLGKAVDVAKLPVQAVQKVNDIINKAGQWAQNTKPVQAFDQKFEELKAKISAKFPNLTQNLTQAGEWAKANPGKTAVIIGVLTAVASLAGGPLGGAIAGQILRGTTELMKGEKLSTAIGKGIKTAALGYLSGKAFEMLGKFVEGMRVKALPVPGAEESGLANVNYGATRTITGPGTEWKQTVQGFNVAVFPEQQTAINDAMSMIRNGQAGGFDLLKTIAQEIRSPEYRAAIKDIMVNARADQLANDGLLKWINGMAQAGQSLSQGAVAAAGDAKNIGKDNTGAAGNQTPTQQSTPESLSFQQIKKIFYTVDRKSLVHEGVMDKLKQFGTNLTTRVTADKLMKAWQAAGSPTDSDAVAEILRKSGVDDSIISSTFQSMNIVSNQSPPVSQASSQPSTKLTVTQINQAIKKLRFRDLESVQKTVDANLAKRKTQPTTP